MPGITPTADGFNDSAVDMAVTRFVLMPYGRMGFRLAARASFQPRMPIEPDRSGMTIELDDASGATLFSATVPADMFEADYSRTRFLYIPDGPPTMSSGGLLRLTVLTGGPSVIVSAKALVPTEAIPSVAMAGDALARKRSMSALVWTIRWNGRCVSKPVHCTPRKKCPPH